MLRYQRYLSDISRERCPDVLRLMVAKTMAASGGDILNLGNGLPHPDCFPITGATFALCDETTISLSPEATIEAMQYCPSEGTHQMQKLLRDFVAHFHQPPLLTASPPDGGTKVIVTAGSSDAIDKVFSMILNRGDYLLVEEYTYTGATTWMRAMGVKPLLLKMDEHGIVPDSLRQQLSRWTPEDANNPDSDIPKLMYVIPSGQNPTGSTLTLERKRVIYQIAREYDLLIFEDDPYYFLSDHRVGSFLSLDEDGRVLRAESFSKTIGGGTRCGYIAGPGPLMDKYTHHVHVSTNGANTLCQVIICELFKRWGFPGFEAHVERLQAFYRKRRNWMIDAANKHLKGLVTWDVPSGGMFLWIKSELLDTDHVINTRGVEQKVLFTAGSAFCPVLGTKTPFIRIAFSYATEADMNKGFQILSNILREELAENVRTSITQQ